jgi:hypothetical protein
MHLHFQISIVNFQCAFPFCNFHYAFPLCNFHYAFALCNLNCAFPLSISNRQFPLSISIDLWNFKLQVKILWTNIENNSNFYGNFIKQKYFVHIHLTPTKSPMVHRWECNSIGILHWTSTTMEIDSWIHPRYCFMLIFPLNS